MTIRRTLPLLLSLAAVAACAHRDPTANTEATHWANAEQLVLVKSCAIDPQMSLRELGEAGVVDPQFAERSGEAAFPIPLLHKNQ